MKNKNNFLKGFTIIELIVVIAIIAVLATIVSTTLMTYITKSKNAAIKANMANLATHGGLFLTNDDNNQNYLAFCDDSKTENFLDKIDELNAYQADEDVMCASNSGNWCVRAYLVPSGVIAKNEEPVFCVDSAGTKKEGVRDNTYCNGTLCSW
jgi:prepilin-type N-terminal cleavage/methylation domain-containing protein